MALANPSLIDPTLAQLLQAASAADSSTPTNIGVAANGESTAEFEGKVKAKGLEMDEATTIATNDDSVLWKEPSTGKIKEGIYAWKETPGGGEGPFHNLALEAGKPFSEGGSNPGIAIQGSDLANNGKVQVFGGGGLNSIATLLDSFGQSSFLRKKGVSSFGVYNVGIAQATFEGGTEAEGQISHGLATTPLFMSMTAFFPNLLLTWGFGASSTVTFNWRARDIDGAPPAGTKITVNWFALG